MRESPFSLQSTNIRRNVGSACAYLLRHSVLLGSARNACVHNPSPTQLDRNLSDSLSCSSSFDLSFGPGAYKTQECPGGLCGPFDDNHPADCGILWSWGTVNWKSLIPSLKSNVFSLFHTDITFPNSELMSLSIAQVIYSSYLRLNSKSVCHWLFRKDIGRTFLRALWVIKH